MSKHKLPDELAAPIIERLPVGVFLTSNDGKIAYANPKAEDIFGFGRGGLTGCLIERLIPEKYHNTHEKLRNDYIKDPKNSAMSDGRTLVGVKKNNAFVKLQIGLTPFNDKYTLVSFIESTNKIIKPSSSNDPLTGLSNRQLFNEYSEKFCKLAIRDNSSISVLFIDLDNFKAVNDQFGHHIGNLMLCEVAKLLRNTFRENDIISRVGGDEFAVCLYGMKNSIDLKAISDRLISRISSVKNIEGSRIDISASIGAVFTYPDRGASIEKMINIADKLMYDAKKSVSGITIVKEL